MSENWWMNNFYTVIPSNKKEQKFEGSSSPVREKHKLFLNIASLINDVESWNEGTISSFV